MNCNAPICVCPITRTRGSAYLRRHGRTDIFPCRFHSGGNKCFVQYTVLGVRLRGDLHLTDSLPPFTDRQLSERILSDYSSSSSLLRFYYNHPSAICQVLSDTFEKFGRFMYLARQNAVFYGHFMENDFSLHFFLLCYIFLCYTKNIKNGGKKL